MTDRPRVFVPELLVEHFEELEFLWDQRTQAVQATDYNAAELAEIEARMEAHLAGLLVGGEAVIELVQPYLSDEEDSLAFAAGYSLLRLREGNCVELVLEAFRGGGSTRGGLREALCHAADRDILDTLESWLAEIEQGAPPRTSGSEADSSSEDKAEIDAGLIAALAEVLAFNDRPRPAARAARLVIEDADPEVRQTAWRAVALAGG